MKVPPTYEKVYCISLWVVARGFCVLKNLFFGSCPAGVRPLIRLEGDPPRPHCPRRRAFQKSFKTRPRLTAREKYKKVSGCRRTIRKMNKKNSTNTIITPLERKCPNCGGRLRLISANGHKPFVGCSGFKAVDCRYKEQLSAWAKF